MLERLEGSTMKRSCVYSEIIGYNDNDSEEEEQGQADVCLSQTTLEGSAKTCRNVQEVVGIWNTEASQDISKKAGKHSCGGESVRVNRAVECDWHSGKETNQPSLRPSKRVKAPPCHIFL